MNCENKVEKDFTKWIGKEQNVKKCPKCKFFIQKNQGCNHMKCANPSCKYEFCWICMGEYSSNHYRNPLLACYGMQNINQSNILVRYPFLRFIKVFLMFLAVTLAIILAIIFSAVIIEILIMYHFFKRIDTRVKTKNRKYLMSLTFLICFFTGIALAPIGYFLIALSLLLSPFILIIIGIAFCLKKRRLRRPS